MNITFLLSNFLYITNLTTLDDSNNSTSYNYYLLNSEGEHRKNETVCINYGMYGCFSLSAPWTSEHRPVSYYPENIQKIDPNFLYFSRHNDREAKYLDLNDPDVIKSTGIDADLPTYFISHGFMEGGNRNWIMRMMRELIKRENCNVIVVDWETGSGPPYTQAVANIRLVGAVTAHLLGELAAHTKNYQLEHVHLIGHSLGAHLSGYVGYTLQEVFNLTVGRITGLDPAEPHFAKARPPVRLDRSAARYVDVVHTDASAFIRGGLGMTERIGHVDFYPNGGTNQPGCDKTVVQYTSESGSFFLGIRKFLGCNHLRSHEYFTESINSECSFMTVSCKSYEDFKNGSCFDCGPFNKNCIRFGFHSRQHYERLIYTRMIPPNSGLVQYLITGEQEPFCKSHYRISVTISNSTESKTHGGEIGQLWFTMHSTTDFPLRSGITSSPPPVASQQQQQRHTRHHNNNENSLQSAGNSDRVALNSGGYHEPGATYTVVVAANSIRALRGVMVEWQYHASFFNPLTWRLLASPRVHVARVLVESLESRDKLIVCSQENKPLITGIPQRFLPGNC